MSRLNNNLHSLLKHHPAIHLTLSRCVPSDRIHFEDSRKGPITAKVSSNEGDIYLHSRIDPKKEADRFIEGNDIKKTGLVLVYGFACGYHVEALMEQLHPKAKAIVIEPDAPLFLSMLQHKDFSTLFADKRLSLMVGASPEDIFSQLESRVVEFFLGAKIITHDVSHRINKTLFHQTSEVVKNFIEYGTTSLYTAASIAAQSKFNSFMNMPQALFNPGIADLKNIAKDKAAVVIGAGPSLAKNIELLRDAPVIKIATGTILKRLLSEGIVPHAVCHIDYHFKLTKKYFQDLPPLDNTLLLMDTRASYKTADMYPGPIATWDDGFMKTFLHKIRETEHGTLPPGATVSQTCYYLAQYLGCDPIIFVGQDLAYPGHLTHMPGTAIYDNWWTETNRFVSMENKEWEYFARVKQNLYSVPAIGGGTIYTDRQMFTYLQSFRQLFQEHPERVIDACEQGAFKIGAEHMSFKEALQQNFNSTDKHFSLLAQKSYANTEERKRYLELFDEYLEEADRTLNFYEKGIKLLDTLRDNFNDNKQQKDLLHKIDKIKSQFDSYQRFTSMINELTQSDDYQKQKDDMEIALGDYTGKELQLKQLERDHKFLKGLRGGLLYFKEFMINGRKRLELYPETQSKDIFEDLDMIKEKILRDES